jgi:RimJ/RimL family protein N-acetyltransferase
MSSCVVYQQRGKSLVARIPLPEGYECNLWRPGLARIVPPGLPWIPFAAWWLMHGLGIYSNRGYGVLMIHCRGELAHRSVVTPRYFRFPFMGKSDLQIGDTWTSEQHRGKGLAGAAIQAILDADPRPDRVYWYICEEANIPSRRVVEKLGFRELGKCVRVSRFGLRLLGAFVMGGTERAT